MSRQVILDTETTGLRASEGHRIIEIGCVEMVERRFTGRTFHHYLNPERDIDADATRVHGITSEMLREKPLFADIADAFLTFVQGAQLIIHNAPFDTSFLNHELKRLQRPPLTGQCEVFDTLSFARKRHPGQKNDLDSLCRRYNVNNTRRDKHGALLDAEILAHVYLSMTGGQVSMSLETETQAQDGGQPLNLDPAAGLHQRSKPLRVIAPSVEELSAHALYLQGLDKDSRGECVWLKLEGDAASQVDAAPA